MLKKSSFGLVFNIISNFIVAILMSFTVAFLMNKGSLTGFTFQSFLQSFIENLTVGFFISSIIPVPLMGASFARKCGAKSEKSIAFHALRVLAIAVVLVLLMALALLFLNLGFSPMFWNIYIKLVPILIAVVYIFLFITLPLMVMLTERICSKD